MKESFYFYKSWYDVIAGERQEVQWEIIHAIMEYVFCDNLVELRPNSKLAFKFIKNDIDRANEKYQSIIEINAEKGKLGNLKRWNFDLYEKVIAKQISIEDAENIAKHRTAIKLSLKDKDKDKDKEQDKNTGPNQEAFRNKIKNISQNVFTKT